MTPACPTVKSASPVRITLAAVSRRLLVTTPSVTTVITAIATANPVSSVRTLRVQRLCTKSPVNDMRAQERTGSIAPKAL